MVDKKRLKRFQTDVDKIRSRASSFSSGKFWSPKAGVNRIRILPPWNDEGYFYKEIVWHYGFKVDGQNRAFPCRRNRGDAKCPACQLVARYQDSKDDDLKSIVQKMKPKGKWFMNIIDRKADSGEVKIFGASFTVARDVLAYFSDADYGDITDPEEGRDIIIERDGTGFTTKYAVRPGAKPTPIGLEDWQSMLHDLDVDTIREEVDGPKMLEMLEEIYGETIDLSGISAGKAKKPKDEDESEVEEEEAKRPKIKKSVSVKSSKKAKEDEDEEDISDGDEDDE